MAHCRSVDYTDPNRRPAIGIAGFDQTSLPFASSFELGFGKVSEMTIHLDITEDA